MSTNRDGSQSPSPSSSTSTSNSRPKPRPITSCCPCRSRKVKCNRLSPCSTCITRGIPDECIYSTPDEDRQAIAQAELISELRSTRNRLRNQVAQRSLHLHAHSPHQNQYQYPYHQSQNHYQHQYPHQNHTQDQYQMQGEREGEEEDEMAELEAIYLALRRGPWDVSQQLVSRIRNGESVRDMARVADMQSSHE